MTKIDAAVNAARIGSEFTETANLEVFTEAAAAGRALAELENGEGFSWEDQPQGWETTCASLAEAIENLAPEEVPDWGGWLEGYLGPAESEFKPDNAKTLELGKAFYAAAASFYHFLQPEAEAHPEGFAASIRLKLAELYPKYEEFKGFVEVDLAKELGDAASAKLQEPSPGLEANPPCDRPKCRVVAELVAHGMKEERAIEFIRDIDAKMAGLAAQLKALSPEIEARRRMAEDEALQAAQGQPAGWRGNAGEKLDEKLQQPAKPEPNPKEAAVKDSKSGPTIKLSGSLAEAWLNDPANKAIVDKYLQKQAQR